MSGTQNPIKSLCDWGAIGPSGNVFFRYVIISITVSQKHGGNMECKLILKHFHVPKRKISDLFSR